MSIELLLFFSVLFLAACCLGLGLLVLHNYTQLKALREALALLDARTARAAARAAEPEDDAAEGPRGLRLIRPAVLEAEIRALVDDGRVLEAVQRYHTETGVSLHVARDAVRNLIEG